MKLKDAISALGGIPAVAEALGAKRSAVSMWGVRDSLPAERVVPFWDLCLSRGVAWEPVGADAIRAQLGGQPAPKSEAA